MKGIIFLVVIMSLFSGCSYDTIVEPSSSINNTISNLPTDSATGALEVIDYAHHEVHSGTHYKYKDYYMINKGASKIFLFKTPDTAKLSHMTLSFEAVSSSVNVILYEDCTYSSIGTLEPVINRNRNYNDTNTALLYENPILSSNGVELESGIYGAGKNSNGGGTRDQEEIVYKRNTNYCVIITEQNVADTNVNILFDWYEHENK